MLRRERPSVVLERDERLAVEHVPERQVRGVAAVARRDQEGRGRIEVDVLEERVDADAAPAHVELRPFRHAADVDRPLASRECQEGVPRPADRLADQALDGERPAVERRPRGRPRGQHGKVPREVLAGRDPRRDVGIAGAFGTAATDEPPGDESVAHGTASSPPSPRPRGRARAIRVDPSKPWAGPVVNAWPVAHTQTTEIPAGCNARTRGRWHARLAVERTCLAER